MFHHRHHEWAERFADRRFARGFFGRHFKHHERGGGDRLLGHGDLRLIALSMIAEAPRHGYELIRAIEERSGGSYAPSPGAIYPTLTLLEDEGFATVQAESGKKLYTVTAEGIAYLDGNRPAVDAAMERLVGSGKGGSLSGFARVMQARHALRHAIKSKLRESGFDAGRLEAIAKLLEDATAAVQKL